MIDISGSMDVFMENLAYEKGLLSRYNIQQECQIDDFSIFKEEEEDKM